MGELLARGERHARSAHFVQRSLAVAIMHFHRPHSVLEHGLAGRGSRWLVPRSWFLHHKRQINARTGDMRSRLSHFGKGDQCPGEELPDNRRRFFGSGPVIADLDDPVADTNRKAMYSSVGRSFQRLPGPDGELRKVPRTHGAIPVDPAG